MASTIRDLLLHQTWADTAILRAIRSHPAVAGDAELRKMLLHIVGVQRFFLSLCLNRPFHPEQEPRIPETLDELEQRFREAHADAESFASQMDAEALARTVEMPRLQMRLQVRDALLQMAMHSQHHRAQCATRLRALGCAPPTVDFILWVKERQAG